MSDRDLEKSGWVWVHDDPKADPDPYHQALVCFVYAFDLVADGHRDQALHVLAQTRVYMVSRLPLSDTRLGERLKDLGRTYERIGERVLAERAYSEAAMCLLKVGADDGEHYLFCRERQAYLLECRGALKELEPVIVDILVWHRRRGGPRQPEYAKWEVRLHAASVALEMSEPAQPDLGSSEKAELLGVPVRRQSYTRWTRFLRTRYVRAPWTAMSIVLNYATLLLCDRAAMAVVRTAKHADVPRHALIGLAFLGFSATMLVGYQLGRRLLTLLAPEQLPLMAGDRRSAPPWSDRLNEPAWAGATLLAFVALAWLSNGRYYPDDWYRVAVARVGFIIGGTVHLVGAVAYIARARFWARSMPDRDYVLLLRSFGMPAGVLWSVCAANAPHVTVALADPSAREAHDPGHLWEAVLSAFVSRHRRSRLKLYRTTDPGWLQSVLGMKRRAGGAVMDLTHRSAGDLPKGLDAEAVVMLASGLRVPMVFIIQHGTGSAPDWVPPALLIRYRPYRLLLSRRYRLDFERRIRAVLADELPPDLRVTLARHFDQQEEKFRHAMHADLALELLRRENASDVLPPEDD